MASEEVKHLIGSLESQLTSIEGQLRQARERFQDEEARNLPKRIKEIERGAQEFMDVDRQRREHRQRLRTELLQIQNAHAQASADLADARRKKEEMDDQHTLEKIAFLQLDREGIQNRMKELQTSVETREKQIYAAQAARDKQVAVRENRLEDALKASEILREGKSKLAKAHKEDRLSSTSHLHDVSKLQQDDRGMVRTLADAVLADMQATRRQERLQAERKIQELNEERFQLDEQLRDVQERAKHHRHVRQRGADVLVAIHEQVAPPIDLMYANRDKSEDLQELQKSDEERATIDGIGLLHVHPSQHETKLKAIEGSIKKNEKAHAKMTKEARKYGYLGLGADYDEEAICESDIGKFLRSGVVYPIVDKAIDIHFKTHLDPTETNERHDVWNAAINPSQLINHMQRTRDLALRAVAERMIKEAVKEAINSVGEDGIALVRAQQAAVDSILAASLQRARQFDTQFRIHGKGTNKERFTVPVPYDEDTATLSGLARQMEERYISLVGSQEKNIVTKRKGMIQFDSDVDLLYIENLPLYCFASRAPFPEECVRDPCRMIDIRQHPSWVEERHRFGLRLEMTPSLEIDASEVFGNSIVNNISLSAPPGGVFMIAGCSNSGKIGVWSARWRNDMGPISEHTPLPGSEDVVVAPEIKTWSPVMVRKSTINIAKRFGMHASAKEIKQAISQEPDFEEKQVIEMAPQNFDWDPDIDLNLAQRSDSQLGRALDPTVEDLLEAQEEEEEAARRSQNSIGGGIDGFEIDENDFSFVELVRAGDISVSGDSSGSKSKKKTSYESSAGKVGAVQAVSFSWNGNRIIVQTSNDVMIFDMTAYRNNDGGKKQKSTIATNEKGVYKLQQLLKVPPKALAQVPSNANGLTPELLRDSAVNASCFFPRVSMFGNQDCLCLGTAGGGIVKYNMKQLNCDMDEELRRPGVAESNRSEEDTLPIIPRPKAFAEMNKDKKKEEESKNKKKNQVIDPNAPYSGAIRREYFQGHEFPVEAMIPLGPSHKDDVVSIDAMGMIFRWRYSEEGFSGYRHYIPVSKQQIDFVDMVLQRCGPHDAPMSTPEPRLPSPARSSPSPNSKSSPSNKKSDAQAASNYKNDQKDGQDTSNDKKDDAPDAEPSIAKPVRDETSDIPSSAGDFNRIPDADSSEPSVIPLDRNSGPFQEPAPARDELFNEGLPLYFDERTGLAYYLQRRHPGAGDIVMCDVNNNPHAVCRYKPEVQDVWDTDGDWDQNDHYAVVSAEPAPPTRSIPVPTPQTRVAYLLIFTFTIKFNDENMFYTRISTKFASFCKHLSKNSIKTEGNFVAAKAVDTFLVICYTVEDGGTRSSYRFVIYKADVGELSDVKIHVTGADDMDAPPLFTLSHTGTVLWVARGQTLLAISTRTGQHLQKHELGFVPVALESQTVARGSAVVVAGQQKIEIFKTHTK